MADITNALRRLRTAHSFGGEGLNYRLDSKQRARKAEEEVSLAEQVADSRVADCQAEIERLRDLGIGFADATTSGSPAS